MTFTSQMHKHAKETRRSDETRKHLLHTCEQGSLLAVLWTCNHMHSLRAVQYGTRGEGETNELLKGKEMHVKKEGIIDSEICKHVTRRM